MAGPTYAYAPIVHFNALAPGWTVTLFLTHRSKADKPHDMAALAKASLLGYLLKPERIAEVVYFLLSPQSSAIVGYTLPCDGGYLASHSWAPYGGAPQA
jgi:NAD(P)-dependent dehydrogenase (short-subunit alcohol dehydrogenase family)